MRSNFIKDDDGQILVLFTILLPVLILLLGLSLDAGLLYVTKAKLSNAVDSACLMGMKNLSKGQVTAAILATDVFKANYGANAPVPTITFPVDAFNDQQVKVSATATVNTFFMRVVPAFKTASVSDTAIATRGKLAMTIVLDRSGSMSAANDNGGTALKAVVPLFVADFDNANDHVALVSFASNATVDFPIATNFIQPIDTAVAKMNFAGGTFGTGAGSNMYNTTYGPPLSLADNENNLIIPQQGQNLIRVIVYLTDGLMNTLQDTFTCVVNNKLTPEVINYGGYDSPSTQVGFSDPTNGNLWASYPSPVTSFPYDKNGDICQNPKGTNVTKFPSQQNGSEPITQGNLVADAQYRAIQTASAIRNEFKNAASPNSNIPTYIFTIGLGDNSHGKAGMSAATQAFLAQLANDPAYPATYETGQPAGLFQYIATCPGAACTNDVNVAFQTIASKILLRLAQ
jgi:Flp pilus assembly protein TadG